MTDTCIACGAPATKLCDYKLGAPIGGYVRVGAVADNRFHAVLSMDRPMFTCDAPICDRCATNKGLVHASGKDGFSETVDYCPCHADSAAGAVLPLTDEEAASVRREIAAYYKRKAMKTVVAVERFSGKAHAPA